MLARVAELEAASCATVVVAGLLITRTTWACSGPDAMERILAAELLGWILFGATVVLLVVAGALARRYRRPWRRLWPIPIIAALHPGWWMSARRGDCGAMLTLGSLAVTLVALVAAVLLVLLARRGARTRKGDVSHSADGSG